jgi:flagellar FliL protein
MSDKKPDPAPEGAAAAAAPAAGGGGGIKAMLPAILALVLAPAATFGVAQFVLLPGFEAKLQAALADPSLKPPEPLPEDHDAPPSSGAPAKPITPGNSYRFENVVVNLAGTMGTRYLKVAFLVTGDRDDVVSRFEAAGPQVGDVTLGVLSSLTLADLEEPGSKNIIRERLIGAYNQVLGGRVVNNLFFSEFVVQ